MVTAIPTVDRTALPDLAMVIKRYARRYEFRLDGSSLWEGRARSRTLSVPHLRMLEMKAMGILASEMEEDGSEEFALWCDRMQRYPAFRKPRGFKVMGGLWHSSDIPFYRHDDCQAVLAMQGTDIFIVHHPDGDGYRWELERIYRLCRELETYTRPRDLFTGPQYLAAHRARQMRLKGNWL